MFVCFIFIFFIVYDCVLLCFFYVDCLICVLFVFGDDDYFFYEIRIRRREF